MNVSPVSLAGLVELLVLFWNVMTYDYVDGFCLLVLFEDAKRGKSNI